MPLTCTEQCDNKTGLYELFGSLTHQGRTAEGGHYVAWVKRDSKKWHVFDDETVAEVDAERIKELYGGGDWHMAYMCRPPLAVSSDAVGAHCSPFLCRCLYRKMNSLRLG